ncbi:MAG: Gfo/Idh/MocA family oxidoreductase [Limisphaerales bacterium]
MKLTRRSFLQKTALATGAITLGGCATHRPNHRVIGANSDIRVAVVGFHGRGSDHIAGLRNVKGVRLVALCDVDKHVLGNGVEAAKNRGENVQGYTDIRKLLEDKNVDVISIATPNHWHALAAIWAMQAGKDVYLEKPVSHNVWEGRQIIKAARKYNCICQAGTQSRSSHGIREAVEWVQKGNLGKILVARGLCYKPRASIGKNGAQKVPDYIDYDLWCGPAPMLPPRWDHKKYGPVHYDWHWFWNYGNGDLGNQGIHQMDIARWFLGEQHLSPRVWAVGGRLGYEDDGETPNTATVFHDYEKAPLIFEVRGLHTPKYMGDAVGASIECEGGRVQVPDYTKAIAFDKTGKEIKRFDGASSHYENFIKGVRSRKVSDLHADISEGHISSALCHTGNISYRLGKAAGPDEIRERIKGDRDAVNTFNRMVEHLGQNDVDLNKTKATLGRFLKMDVAQEKFIDSSDADAMLTREYRKPFVVPTNV